MNNCNCYSSHDIIDEVLDVIIKNHIGIYFMLYVLF